MFHDVSTCLMDCVTCFLGFTWQFPNVLLPQPVLFVTQIIPGLNAMFILSENTLLHGVRGFGWCSWQVVPTRSVRFLRTFDHYTGPVTVLSCSNLFISECSKPMGLKSKCSLAQFSCILEASWRRERNFNTSSAG